MEKVKENIYAETKERYYLRVPILRKTEYGTDCYVPVVCLSSTENYQIKKKAYDDTLKAFDGKVPKNDEASISTWNSLHEDNLGAWSIYYSFRNPEDLDKKWFLSKEQIINDYTSQELGILYTNCITVVLNQPAIKHINKDDPDGLSSAVDLIIKQATVEDTAFFLSSLTTVSVAELMRYLVEKVNSLQPVNGSSGQPSNDTSPTV